MTTAILDDAVEQVLKVVEERPDKNLLSVWNDLQEERRPKYSGLMLNRQSHPDDDNEDSLPEEDSKEARLVRDVQNIIRPLSLENPIVPALSVGFGTGLMSTAFGVELDYDIEGCPAKEHRQLSAFDDFEVPDPEQAGVLPEIRGKIQFYKEHTPPDIKIRMPDIQGPFNIAYSVVGNPLLLAPYDDPDRYHRFMELLTEFYIRAQKAFEDWIGSERLIKYVRDRHCIRECECNLISGEMYREFVKPYDRKIAEEWGEVAIHTCSGPHIFKGTLDLPNLRYTECGIIPCAVAGSLSVEEALPYVDIPPVILGIGQELERGKEESLIKKHLALRKEYPLLSFGYTGMYWTPEDDEQIVDMHKRLDEFYMEEVSEP
jgi:hypothetical protein